MKSERERIKAVPRYRPKYRTSAASFPKVAVVVEPVVDVAVAAFEGARY